jgi:2-methylcitrate dehydratase PrpD
MSEESVTARLVRRGLEVQYAELPNDLIRLAALCVLDYAGVTLAGTSDPAARILRQEIVGAERGPCVIVGCPDRTTPSQAALINGTAGHALDYDDVHMALPGHVSVTILPAILALAEARDLSPKRIVASFVAGYETACRIGQLVAPGHYARGFHATATIGSFGAAMACAHLLGLDETRASHALAIAGAQGAGLKAQFGTMCKALHAGKAAQNGIFAALLAERGFEGSTDILGASQGFGDAMSSNMSPEAALAEASDGFHLRNNLFKFHASCYGTHGLIEAVRKLRGLGVDGPRDLVSVTARVGVINDKMCNIKDPRNGTEAKFSLRFMGAFSFCGVDTARLDTFDERALADPAVREAAAKITVVPDPSLSMTQAIVVARLQNGSELTTDHDAATPERDLEKLAPRLRAKFVGLAGSHLGAAAAEATAETIWRFSTLDEVGQLTRLLAGSKEVAAEVLVA